jgi:hypothetical protein
MITHDARRSLPRGNNPVPSPWLATDSNLPTELVALIDLPFTPEVPGIHLPWTCAAPG